MARSQRDSRNGRNKGAVAHEIDMEGTGLQISQGAADRRLILFYESFNYHAEIPALFQDCGYLVFKSDRHQAVVPKTSSFVPLPNDCTPTVTSALGFPIPSRRG